MEIIDFCLFNFQIGIEAIKISHKAMHESLAPRHSQLTSMNLHAPRIPLHQLTESVHDMWQSDLPSFQILAKLIAILGME